MLEHTDKVRDLVGATIKTSPIAVYALTLNEWVGIATLVYIALQSAFLIWRWRREANRERPE